ncbi:MAG: phosphate acyltransferase PlsX [Oscillospiraceae bacterium]|nr:phosphate acyltransferase PlsX [Oscillospiraceae bacterium]
MTIIIDAFGGDNAPFEILKGAAEAVKELNINIILTGDDEKIRACADKNGIPLGNIEVLNAPDIISMEADPVSILKENKNSSMSAGFAALAGGMGDAFVSAGNTGALVVGSTFIVKRISGIKRAAIGAVLPSNEAPFLLIDTGANVECQPHYLAQFAKMGGIYMNKVLGVENPKIGLANIGIEETKGTPVIQAAYELLRESNMNFIGNAEVRDIPFGGVDVVTADGFTGNIILKMYEGVAAAMMQNIKGIYKKNRLTMISAMLVKNDLAEFKKKMDYTEFGGAPLLGVQKPVIKAHGSSDAKTFKSAVKQAVDFVNTNVIEEIGLI